MRLARRAAAGLLAGVALAAALRLGPPAAASPLEAAAPPGLRWEAVADGLRLDWQAPPAGAADAYAPLSALVALPPGAAPRLEVERLVESASAGPAEAPAAEAALQIEAAGVMRGVSLARLTFYPARRQAGRLRLTTRVEARLLFNAPAGARSSEGLEAGLDAVRAIVLNPAQVWPAPAAPSAARAAPAAAAPRAVIEVTQTGLTAITYADLAAAGFPLDGDPARLRLTRAGGEVAAEWDGDGDTAFENGERLLFYAAPRFNRYTAADAYFLEAGATPALRLSTRAADPAARPAGPAWVTSLFERNLAYTPNCLCGRVAAGRDGDRWVWATLRQTDQLTQTLPFTLTNVAPGQPASLTVWLIGATDVSGAPDHRVAMAVNGAGVGTAEWNGRQAITATVPITAGLLHSGVNTFTVSLPGLPGVAVEEAWLDAFAVRQALGPAEAGPAVAFTGELTASAYSLAFAASARAYDVTDPDQPVRLTGVTQSNGTLAVGDPAAGLPRRYALTAEAGLLSPARVRLAAAPPSSTDADYVLISPAEFTPALAALVTLRQNQGLSTAVIDLQAVYDAYDGRPTPDAVRAFLDQAYQTWQPPPLYVVLVGDGSADPRRYLAGSAPTIIPPYLADVDPVAGETAADNRYATLEGADLLPDIALGRLPVNSLAETQAVVDKIVQYETAPAAGAWANQVVFVSDAKDVAGDFPADSQTLADTHVAWPWAAQQITLTVPAAPAQQAVRAAWEAGAGLMVYNGHASIHQWSVARLFHLDDVAQVQNAGRWPVLLELTCFTGAFQTPGFDTLDEALVRAPDGGAVAAWGATGLGVARGHTLLADGFLAYLRTSSDQRLGAAALAGKLQVAASPQAALFADLLDTFLVLGDPALRITLSPGRQVFLPLVQR